MGEYKEIINSDFRMMGSLNEGRPKDRWWKGQCDEITTKVLACVLGGGFSDEVILRQIDK